jgi:hypothetical protein
MTNPVSVPFIYCMLCIPVILEFIYCLLCIPVILDHIYCMLCIPVILDFIYCMLCIPVILDHIYCMLCIPVILDFIYYFHISHSINSTDLHPSPAAHLKTPKIFLTYFPKVLSLRTIQSSTPTVALYWALFQIQVQFAGEKSPLVECCFFHDNSGFNFTRARSLICYQTSQIV